MGKSGTASSSDIPSLVAQLGKELGPPPPPAQSSLWAQAKEDRNFSPKQFQPCFLFCPQQSLGKASARGAGAGAGTMGAWGSSEMMNALLEGAAAGRASLKPIIPPQTAKPALGLL